MTRPARVATRLGALALLVAAVLTAVGCGGGTGTNGSGGSTTGSAAEPTAGGVLRFGLESPPTTLDPSRVIEASALIVVLQYSEGLLELNDEGKAVPNLASDFKSSADGLTWTFTLQKGVTFSDGKPMTAKDVAFSLEQAKTSPYFAGLYEPISKITAPSPDEVVLKLSSPNPALPAQLAFYTAYIVPDGYAGMSEKEFAQNPIGTGPFAISSARRGGAITLTQNTHYWKQDKPHLDELVFTPVTDENSRLQQIRGGELDMTKATAISTKTGVPAGSGIRIEETTQNIVDYLLLNQHNPLFKNPKVREAINLAIDREGIIQTATDGKGALGASFLPPAVTYAIDAEPPARDVAKAKQLIAEAAKEGVDTSFKINSYNFDAYSGFATQILQQDLEEIGLTVELQPLDEAALNELLETGEYDAVQGLYLPALSDPSELSGFYVAFFAPGAGQDVDGLTKVVEEAAVETDEQKRAGLYAQLQEMMIEEESLLVINYQPVVFPVVEEVTGVELDPVGDLLLRNAGFAE